MRLFGKYAAALVLLVYVAAFAGFRLHECFVDQTVEVLPLLAGDKCEEVHHHHCTDKRHCAQHHHHCAEEHTAGQTPDDGLQLSQADCCTNLLYCLSDVQIASDASDCDVVLRSLPGAPAASVDMDLSAQPAVSFVISYREAPRPAAGRIVLALYSVRRV